MLLNEIYDTGSYTKLKSFSEIDHILTQVKKQARAWVSVDERVGTAVLTFNLEENTVKIIVKAKPGVGSRKGKTTLLSSPEVLIKRAKAAAIAQRGGHMPQDFEEVRETLLGGVGPNVIRRFLNPDAFEIEAVYHD